MKKIIFSSGPRGGKSSIITQISEWLESKGYIVYVISETAQELFDQGLNYEKDPVEAQRGILKRQVVKELDVDVKIQLSDHDTDKVIVLLDRSVIDGYAFIGCEKYDKVLSSEGLSDSCFKLYNMAYCIHLQSLAVSFADKYDEDNSMENTVVRREDASAAALMDYRLFSWYDIFCDKGIIKKHFFIPATKTIEEKLISVCGIIESEILTEGGA